MRVSIFKSRSFFIEVEMFQFKSRFFLFKLRCFYSSRDFFMSRFLFQVENFFFSCRDLYFKSRIFFFMSRFVFQVQFFLMSRIFSCRHLSFQEENVFLPQVEIFVLFEVFQADISQFKARCYPGVLVGISWQ